MQQRRTRLAVPLLFLAGALLPWPLVCSFGGACVAGESVAIVAVADTAGFPRSREGDLWDWFCEIMEASCSRAIALRTVCREGMTLAEATERLRSLGGEEPDLVVLVVGAADAFSASSGDFENAYRRLLALLSKRFPHSWLLVATPPVLPSSVPESQRRRFKEPGSLLRFFEREVVQKILSIAKAHTLPVCDLFHVLRTQENEGKPSLTKHGRALTPWGAFVAAQSLAHWTVRSFYVPGARWLPVLRYPPQKQPPVQKRTKETQVDLPGYVDLWEKELEPQLRKVLADPYNPNLRQVVFMYGQARYFSGEVCKQMVELLGKVDQNTQSAIYAWLRGVAGDRAVPYLCAVIERDYRARYIRKIVPFITAMNPAGVTFSEGLRVAVRFMLQADNWTLKRDTVNLCLAFGEPGRRTLMEAIQTGDEKAAMDLLDILLRQTKDAELQETVKRFVLKTAARKDHRPLAAYCRRKVLDRFLSEAPADLLLWVAESDTEHNARWALYELASRGREGVERVADLLKKDDRALAAASLAALWKALFSQADTQAAKKTFQVLCSYYEKKDAQEFLEDLQGAFEGLPGGSFPSRRAFYSRYSRRVGRSVFGVSRGKQHRARLAWFASRLRELAARGTEDERFAALSLLFSLWQEARTDRKAERVGFSRVSGRRSLREKDVAVLLAERAEKAFAAGNKEDCILKTRRAAFAGAAWGRLHGLAWKLAVTPEKSLRDPKEAERLTRRVITHDGRKPQYLDTLAACLANQGRYQEAVKVQREALAKLRDPRSLGAYAARLLLYRQKKPYLEAFDGNL